MLRSIARHYINQDISNFCFVFPNRRAGVFFDKYIQEEATQTIIAPEILTISDLFQHYSTSKVADNLTLLFELYAAYSTVLTAAGRPVEPISDFASFGQTLITDFNDIDNYQVDARKIFQNIDDLQELNSDSYLTDNQKAALERLFIYKGVDNVRYCHRDHFKSIWSMLYDIYSTLKESLQEKGMAYSGMLCRSVVEECGGTLDTPFSKVIFVGFNALNEVERSLFKALGDKAEFYWDYNLPGVSDSDNLAHKFVTDNVGRFPTKKSVEMSSLPEQTSYTHIITSSMTAQATEVKKILNSLNANNINTAIVLLDEQMLLPVLMNLPIYDTDRYKINVTMGFPISHTPVIKFIEAFIVLQNGAAVSENSCTFYHKHVTALLTHPYVAANASEASSKIQDEILRHNTVRVDAELFQSSNSDLLKHIFCKYSNDELLTAIDKILHCIKPENDYDAECIEQVKVAINNTTALVQKYNHVLEPPVLLQFIRQVISRISVSFKGEPLDGLQIMGTLETRCLTFDNIIFLSFNEGVFPKTDNQNSYIPYNLRHAFGMPTTEHQDAVYAYNFYRLIARAKNVFMISDCRTDNMKNGEASRYLNQLKYIYDKDIETRISSSNTLVEHEAQEIQKPSDWLDKFKNQEIVLSASSINTYLKCGVKFYISKYLKINESNEISEIMETNQFGSVFHKAMESLYTQLKKDLRGGPFTKVSLMNLYNNQIRIEEAVDDAMRTEFFNNSSKYHITGINSILCTLMVQYIKKVIQVDSARTPFTLEACEKKFEISYQTKDERFNEIPVYIKGFIDRVDSYFDSSNIKRTRLIDYKTGSVKSDLTKGIDKPENETTRQLMLYKYYMENRVPASTIDLDVYNLPGLHNDITTPTAMAYTEDKYKLFCELIDSTVTDILSPDVNLRKPKESEKQNVCKYCDFTNICRRLK